MQFKNKAPSLVIGICGGSGSGKTFLLEQLTAHLGARACLLSQDHYYKPLAEQEKDARGKVNFDLPEAIDEPRFIADLDQLINGRPVRIKEYTFNNPAVPARILELRAAPLIIVEGLFIFHSEAISRRLSLKVFVESEAHIALKRRLQRDIRERAYTKEMILYQWEHHVTPAYRQYLLPYRDSADLIIRNPADCEPDLKPLLDLIWTESK